MATHSVTWFLIGVCVRWGGTGDMAFKIIEHVVLHWQ